MVGFDNDKLATVIGGSGFVGRHSVRLLAQQGWRIRAGSRRPDLAGHLQPMGRVGQIHAVQTNIRYPESVARAVEDADAVVNLVSVLAPSGRQSFEALNVDGARCIARAAKAAGVKRLVHVSAIGADPASQGSYGRTKAAGEAAVLEEFPEAIILRPSIVFGPEDEFFNKFAAMGQTSPFLPLVGGGKTRFQPIFVGDLAAAIAGACNGRGKRGTIYEIGGPEIFTFRQLLDRTQTWSGRERGYISMPFWLTKIVALLTWPLPNSLRPITVDQVRMLESDNVVGADAIAEGRTISSLGVGDLHMIGSVVPAYLEQYRPQGQYSHYRG